MPDADVVILAMPVRRRGRGGRHGDPGRVAGKTIIDVTNPMKPDFSGLATAGSSAAEEVQKRLPEASVVKAFNTIFAIEPGEPERARSTASSPPTTRRPSRQVISLVDSMGFTPLDVGPLSAARFLEGMAFINIGLNAHNGWSWTSAWKLER